MSRHKPSWPACNQLNYLMLRPFAISKISVFSNTTHKQVLHSPYVGILELSITHSCAKTMCQSQNREPTNRGRFSWLVCKLVYVRTIPDKATSISRICLIPRLLLSHTQPSANPYQKPHQQTKTCASYRQHPRSCHWCLARCEDSSCRR